MQDAVVWCGGPVRLGDDTESAAVIPHGPTDVVGFEGAAYIFDPAGAIAGIGEISVHAKFVAGEWNVMGLGPLADEVHFTGDAVAVPMPVSHLHQLPLRQGIVLFADSFLDRLGSDGIGNIAQVNPKWNSPACPLVGEQVRLIADIGVRRSRNDDGVLRSSTANFLDGPLLDADPAVRILQFGLVHDFEEHLFAVVGSKMIGNRSPQQPEFLRGKVVRSYLAFELRAGMNVENDRQTFRQCFVEDGIERLYALTISPRPVAIEDGGIDAEAHMIESQTAHERDVVERGVGRESLGAVVRGLREPLASIDTVPQALRTPQGRRRSRILRNGNRGKNESNDRKNKRSAQHCLSSGGDYTCSFQGL